MIFLLLLLFIQTQILFAEDWYQGYEYPPMESTDTQNFINNTPTPYYNSMPPSPSEPYYPDNYHSYPDQPLDLPNPLGNTPHYNNLLAPDLNLLNPNFSTNTVPNFSTNTVPNFSTNTVPNSSSNYYNQNNPSFNYPSNHFNYSNHNNLQLGMLDGVWISNANDTLIIKGRDFQLSNPQLQYLFGTLEFSGNKIRAFVPSLNVIMEYTITFQGKSFVAKDNAGNILYFNRLSSGESAPLIQSWDFSFPQTTH